MSVAFTQSSAGFTANSPTLRIKKITGGAASWYYMTPEPLLSFNNQQVTQGNTVLGWQSSVTLSCFATCGGETASDKATALMGDISTVESFFRDGARLEVYSQAGGTNPIQSWSVLNPQISVEESNFFNLVKYNISFESFVPALSGTVLSDVQQEGHVNPYSTGSTQLLPIESFSDVFTYEPDSSFGRAFDDSTAQVYRFSRTISAKARPDSNDNLNKSIYNANAVSGAKAFVDTRMNIDTFKPYTVSDEYRYDNNLTVFNLSKSYSIDLGEQSFSVTINGLYANSSLLAENIKQSGAFETFTTTVQKDANSSIVNVSVDGKLSGYAVGAVNDQQNKIAANASAGAYHILSRISDGGKYGYGSIVYKRAQNASNTPLNSIPKSISVSDSTIADNSISYNVQYDNRPTPLISGAITESITVNDTYPTDVFASIQIMGKRTGPVFQYMNTVTNFERDVSIELVMDTQKIFNVTNSAELMNFSPSIDSNTRAQLNTLINNLSPVQTEFTMLKSCNESWSPRDGRYTLNIGWTYR